MLLFMSGFDRGTDLALYGITGANAAVSNTQARTGTRSLAMTGLASYAAIALTPGDNRFIIGGGIYVAALPASALTLISLYAPGTDLTLTVEMSSGGALSVKRGATVLGTSAAGALGAAGWHHFSLNVLVADAAGTYTLRINGVEVTGGTGLDTKNSATAGWESVRLGGSNSPNVFWDDVVICDGTGAEFNTTLADLAIHTLVPTEDGALNGWTPSTGTDRYALVDEVPPSSADYVSADTLDASQTFGVTALGTGTVAAVVVTAVGLKDTSGATKAIAPTVRSGGTEYEGAEVGLGTGLTVARSVWTENPATSDVWTSAEVNAAEFGVKLTTAA